MLHASVRPCSRGRTFACSWLPTAPLSIEPSAGSPPPGPPTCFQSCKLLFLRQMVTEPLPPQWLTPHRPTRLVAPPLSASGGAPLQKRRLRPALQCKPTPPPPRPAGTPRHTDSLWREQGGSGSAGGGGPCHRRRGSLLPAGPPRCHCLPGFCGGGRRARGRDSHPLGGGSACPLAAVRCAGGVMRMPVARLLSQHRRIISRCPSLPVQGSRGCVAPGCWGPSTGTRLKSRRRPAGWRSR